MSSGIEACLNVSRFFFEVFRKTHAVPLQKTRQRRQCYGTPERKQ